MMVVLKTLHLMLNHWKTLLQMMNHLKTLPIARMTLLRMMITQKTLPVLIARLALLSFPLQVVPRTSLVANLERGAEEVCALIDVSY